MKTKLKTKTYEFISTPGHGYLVVPIADLIKYELTDKFTVYSYISLDKVYLEEDTDCSTFVQEMKARGVEIRYKEKHVNNPRFRDDCSGYDKFLVEEDIDIGSTIYVLINGEPTESVVESIEARFIIASSRMKGRFKVNKSEIRGMIIPKVKVSDYQRLRNIIRFVAGSIQRSFECELDMASSQFDYVRYQGGGFEVAGVDKDGDIEIIIRDGRYTSLKLNEENAKKLASNGNLYNLIRFNRKKGTSVLQECIAVDHPLTIRELRGYLDYIDIQLGEYDLDSIDIIHKWILGPSRLDGAFPIVDGTNFRIYIEPEANSEQIYELLKYFLEEDQVSYHKVKLVEAV